MSISLEAGTITSLATTELNSLANNQAAIGVEFDNSAAGTLWIWAMFELTVTFGTAPTANNLVELQLLTAPDGTNYGDGTSGASPVAPLAAFTLGFPVRAVTTLQRIEVFGPGGFSARFNLPPTKFKAQLVNKSGQAFPASGSTLKMVPYRMQ